MHYDFGQKLSISAIVHPSRISDFCHIDDIITNYLMSLPFQNLSGLGLKKLVKICHAHQNINDDVTLL